MDHHYTSVICKAEGIDDMLGKLSRGTNLNDNSNCQCLIWPAALAFFRASSKETSTSTVNWHAQESHKLSRTSQVTMHSGLAAIHHTLPWSCCTLLQGSFQQPGLLGQHSSWGAPLLLSGCEGPLSAGAVWVSWPGLSLWCLPIWCGGGTSRHVLPRWPL